MHRRTCNIDGVLKYIHADTPAGHEDFGKHVANMESLTRVNETDEAVATAVARLSAAASGLSEIPIYSTKRRDVEATCLFAVTATLPSIPLARERRRHGWHAMQRFKGSPPAYALTCSLALAS
ncbi:Aste57867_15871 [Aphanomyces stellatus]|uniref:Aste57867_15871 protein n=1 Tax=Aphanomyces stellatus TaxID=120398 RepID=A0A485L537_9STRA|nr:hypothetical protein As57867_015815 [Aphanomyces stellatus]VFT92658.1 Aste57867_15871 [Aphanomyces stellatus]